MQRTCDEGGKGIGGGGGGLEGLFGKVVFEERPEGGHPREPRNLGRSVTADTRQEPAGTSCQLLTCRQVKVGHGGNICTREIGELTDRPPPPLCAGPVWPEDSVQRGESRRQSRQGSQTATWRG